MGHRGYTHMERMQSTQLVGTAVITVALVLNTVWHEKNSMLSAYDMVKKLPADGAAVFVFAPVKQTRQMKMMVTVDGSGKIIFFATYTTRCQCSSFGAGSTCFHGGGAQPSN